MSSSRQDRSHRRSRAALLAVATAVTMLLGSCSWTSGDQYFIHWGAARDDVIIRERTSWDLTLSRGLFYANNDRFAGEMGNFTCHGNRSWTSADRCVFKLLHSRTGVPSLGKGFWERATSDVTTDEPNLADFREAFGTVVRSASSSLRLSDCLTMSQAAVSGANWTTRSRSDSNCRVGKHVWE